MRKLVLITGVFALAACGSDAEAPAEEAPVEEIAEVDPAVGSYTWTEDDGTEVTGFLNADGTSWIEVGGERMDESTWARNEEDQICISWEAGVDDDGEEYEAGSDCMTFGEVGEDGTLEVTDADGDVDVVTKVS